MREVTSSGVASRLVSAACHLFGVTEGDLRGDSRQTEIVSARRAIIKVLAEQVGWSYPRIGVLIDKDHSTALRAHVRANHCYRTDATFHEAVTRLQQEISQ